MFADISRFESIRVVRKEPGASTTVSFVKDDRDAQYLNEQRARQKLIGFGSSRSELLLARRVLLVEGASDKIAVHITADSLGKDPDAEDVAIVQCGSKSAIRFVARICRALSIPFVVLHDDDLYPEPVGDDGLRQRTRSQNKQEMASNAEVKSAAGDADVFVLSPSLEGVLGIGKSATDKPRRVLEALEPMAADELPTPLRHAVLTLFSSAAD